MSATPTSRTYRTCPLCEATCGLELTLEGTRVTRVRGDREDVFSAGYLCPKGVALGELHHDPDRLRAPLVRRDGRLVEAGWDEAFAAVAAGFAPLLAVGERDAIALYGGNPLAHNMEASLYFRPLVRALRSKNLYTSSTVDQMPAHLVAGLLYGDPYALAVPDVDRLDHLLMIGANPWESNGSLWTAPNLPARLKALRQRGGTLVVVDPRRTRTARHAGRHLPIRPGTDAAWLLALAQVMLAEGLARPGRLAPWLAGVDGLAGRLRPFTPEAVARHCGIDAATTRGIARAFAASPAAACYLRFGPQATRSGTLATWAAQLLNHLSGNVDRPGGLMFPRAPHDRLGPAPGGFRHGRWRSRVRGCPEVMNEFPAATLADEIETAGPGQVRGLVTVAGNPVLSNPDGRRLARALASLDFMVSVDIYLNETTRHAHVILPPPSPLERGHYDLLFNRFAVRSVARYASPVFAPAGPSEAEILARLALILGGAPADTDTTPVHAALLDELIMRELASAGSALAGQERETVLAGLGGATPVERILDFLLRSGPFGDAFGALPDGLSLARLADAPHGLDFGPMVEALPGRIRTASGAIELLHPLIDDELARAATELAAEPPDLLLVGRREFKSNNSWLHNLPTLADAERCVLHMHPRDAGRRALADGVRVRLSSAVGAVEVPLAITDEVAPGVVSLPHGYGHGEAAAGLTVAARYAGASYNDVAPGIVDGPSGNAALNGIAVEVSAA